MYFVALVAVILVSWMEMKAGGSGSVGDNVREGRKSGING